MGFLGKSCNSNQNYSAQSKIGSHTASTNETALANLMQFACQSRGGPPKPVILGHFGRYRVKTGQDPVIRPRPWKAAGENSCAQPAARCSHQRTFWSNKEDRCVGATVMVNEMSVKKNDENSDQKQQSERRMSRPLAPDIPGIKAARNRRVRRAFDDRPAIRKKRDLVRLPPEFQHKAVMAHAP